MGICFNIINSNYNGYANCKNNSQSNQPSFQGAKARKILEQVSKAKTFKNIHLTFDEMVSTYNELGYDVLMKRGSHAVIVKDSMTNYPLVIPHGNKYVHPNDVKRLQCVMNGEFDKAARI